MVDANIVPTSGQLRDAWSRTVAGVSPEAERLLQVAVLVVGILDLAAGRATDPRSEEMPAAELEAVPADLPVIAEVALTLPVDEAGRVAAVAEAGEVAEADVPVVVGLASRLDPQALRSSITAWSDQLTANATARGQIRVDQLTQTPKARQLADTMARAAAVAGISLEHAADETHDIVEEQLARLSGLPQSLLAPSAWGIRLRRDRSDVA